MCPGNNYANSETQSALVDRKLGLWTQDSFESTIFISYLFFSSPVCVIQFEFPFQIELRLLFFVFLSPSMNFRNFFFFFPFTRSRFTSHPIPPPTGETWRSASANASSLRCQGCPRVSLLCQIRSTAIYSKPLHKEYRQSSCNAPGTALRRFTTDKFHRPKFRRTFPGLELRLFSLAPGGMCNGQALRHFN
jgi:hypothetical protein